MTARPKLALGLRLAVAVGARVAVALGSHDAYRHIFTADSAGTSTCVDACATAWPPVIITGDPPAVPAGVSGALTTIARPDGSMQLALNGMPVYY